MMATNIIAVSKNIEEILIKWDKANPKKIKVIHHGFDFDYFKMVDEERVISLREKYGLVKQQRPIVGVIARYLEWKGIQYILPAFERLRSHYPSAHLILANAHGEYAPLLKQKLADLPKESYTEISFETDLAALYRLFDVYVHVPIDPYVEAFGQTYVEALLCRVPCVFTQSGISREFIDQNENALVVNFKDAHAIYNGLKSILGNETLQNRLRENGFKSVQGFSLDTHILALLNLYNRQE
jgi:glycosyltransferase involved in cell wall biosynthesis